MEGSLNSGEADTIEVTFDTNGLEKNQTYNGFIALTTNVLGNEFITIPISLFTGPPVSVDEDEINPIGFELIQNYPNPFNPNTIITYSVPVKTFINITVYNVIGKEIITLVDEEKPAGTYEVEFSGAGESASGINIYNLPSGVYIYRLTAGSFTNSKKMILLK